MTKEVKALHKMSWSTNKFQPGFFLASTYFIVHISLAHPQFAKDGEEKRVVLTAAAWLDVSNQRCGAMVAILYNVHHRGSS